MTRFMAIPTIILLIQLHLIHSQFYYPGLYNPYGYQYPPFPPPYFEPLLPNQPEVVETPTNPNQPNIIIIKDDDEKSSKKDKFRFEEILTLLLTTHLGRDRGREREGPPPPPPQSQGGGGGCCCNNGNNDNGNQNLNKNGNNGNGGGTTVHITIVLPDSLVSKSDNKL